MSELKPCPFCGGEAILCKSFSPDGNYLYDTVHVMCTSCHCRTKDFMTSIHYDNVYKVAIDAWNMRVEQC